MKTKEQIDRALEDDVRKLLGLPPYNSPANFCWHDNYYAHSLNCKYGEVAVRKMTKKLQKEEKL